MQVNTSHDLHPHLPVQLGISITIFKRPFKWLFTFNPFVFELVFLCTHPVQDHSSRPLREDTKFATSVIVPFQLEPVGMKGLP